MSKNLVNQAVELALRLSPARAQSVADMLCNEPVSFSADELRWVGEADLVDELVKIVASWRQAGFPFATLGGVFSGATAAAQSIDASQSIDIVWTGPKTRHVPVRRTEQALIDLIASAEHEIFLVSFVVYEHKALIDALKIAHKKGVTIRALVEAPKAAGGNLEKGDPVKAMRKALPDAIVYVWVDRGAEFELGAVHAKIAIADHDQALVSSANFTGRAMEQNMEAGLLVRGGSVPMQLSAHLEALIDTKVLRVDAS